MKRKLLFLICCLLCAVLCFSCSTETGGDVGSTNTGETKEEKKPEEEKKTEEPRTPEPNTVTYIVKHYQQKTSGDEYTLFETQQLAVKQGNNTNAVAKNYEHFTAKPFAQAPVADDGSTCINIYYDRQIITISFEANGGSWSDGSTATKTFSGRYGASIPLNDYPRKTGYGTTWDKTVQTLFSFDETYTALYEAGLVNYTVKHFRQNIENDNYPEEAYETELKTGRTDTQTEAETKTYTGFISPQVIQQLISGDGSTVIRLEYERKTYAVNFDSKGGDTVESQNIKYGAKVTLPTAPDKTHYIFQGWFTSSDGGTTLTATTFDFDTEITGVVNLYAKWEGVPVSYTVRHLWQNNENDNYTLNESETKTGKYGEQTAATAKTYTGFTVQTFSQQSILGNDPIVIEVRYNRNVYTVTFDSKGGSEVVSQNVRYGGKASGANVPTKNPCTFRGWYKSNDNGTTLLENAFNFNSEINSNVTLYAKWRVVATADNVAEQIAAMTESDIVEVQGEIDDSTITAISTALKARKLGMQIDLTNTNGLTTIPRNAFYEGFYLTVIMLPEGLTSIGEGAFYRCKFSTIRIPSTVTSIGDCAFDFCNNLTEITIPSGVTSIEHSTFCDCIALKSVTIPDTVTSIGQDAFLRCSSLEHITIPSSVTNIGDGRSCFGASKINNITIPDSLTDIGMAFSGCKYLTEVTIPSSVTILKESAFQNCTNLQSVTIPASVERIERWAFSKCSSLVNITFCGTKEQWTAIPKSRWNSVCGFDNEKIPATKVICSDGEIDL